MILQGILYCLIFLLSFWAVIDGDIPTYGLVICVYVMLEMVDRLVWVYEDMEDRKYRK